MKPLTKFVIPSIIARITNINSYVVKIYKLTYDNIRKEKIRCL